MYRFLDKICFFAMYDDLQFTCIFHKQSRSESGSEIKIESGSKKIIADPLELIYEIQSNKLQVKGTKGDTKHTREKTKTDINTNLQ
jgi:hypothetical protein